MDRLKKAANRFRVRHPDFPLWISVIALIASITMPVLRIFLARMI